MVRQLKTPHDSGHAKRRNKKSRRNIIKIIGEHTLVGLVVANSIWILWVQQSSRVSLDASSLINDIGNLHFTSAPSAKAIWNSDGNSNNINNTINNDNNNNSTTASESALLLQLISKSAASVSASIASTSTTVATSTVSIVSKQQRLPLPKSKAYYDALRIASVIKDQKEYRKGIDKHIYLYRSCCGLGHRLLRQAASFRYARDRKAPHLWIQWSVKKPIRNCGLHQGYGHIDLYEYYFGAGPMVLLDEAESDLDDYQVDNVGLWDVGSIDKQLEMKASDALAAANVSASVDFDTSRLQVFSNHMVFEERVGVSGVVFHNNGPPGYGKHCIGKQTRDQMLDQGIIDDRFYRQLKASFLFNDRVRAFADEHRFSERLVLGIHIRAGNGETGDFVNKNRGIEDIDSWVVEMAKTMDQLIRKIQLAQHDKVKNNTSSYYSSSTLLSSSSLPPLLFVATDDGLVVGKMANATKPYNIEAISLPQERMETGSGVSYKGFKSKSEDNQCKESWFSQIADAILLGAADVVIAARYSSFTQSLPLVSVLSGSIRERKRKRANGEDDTAMATDTDNTSNNMGSVDGDGAVDENETNTRFSRRLFCEGNGDGNGIQCYDDYLNWMLFKNQLFIPSEKVFRGAEARAYYSREVLAPCPLPQK
uniref:Uncharacterized protein n=1 Tax=Pseudo-nitzschia australis TaxID=44445 RepID=A0A7S4ARS6_9STRA